VTSSREFPFLYSFIRLLAALAMAGASLAPFWAQTASAPKTVNARWAPGVYHLGNRIPLEVQVEVPAPAFYLQGGFAQGADWGSARVASLKQVLPASFPGLITLKAEVQVFATGQVALPPVDLSVNTAKGSEAFLIKAPPINITPLLPPGVQPPPPIAAPLKVPSPLPWGWWTLALLLTAAGIAALMRWAKRISLRRSSVIPVASLKETDPDRWVRQEIDRIFSGGADPYVLFGALSERLREYLEIKLSLPFLEWTTSEVHDGCRGVDRLSGQPTTDLMGVLTLCDWAVFARYRPEASEIDDARVRSHRILDALAGPPSLEQAS
jgi:hypothetical protein